MNIIISNDHAGTELKNVIKTFLENKGFTVINVGEDLGNSVDYPDYIHPLAKDISNKNSFYWPKLDTRKNGWINWNWESKEIVDFINSFSEPYSGASTMLNNEVIRLKIAKKANSKIKFHFHTHQAYIFRDCFFSFISIVDY